MSEDFLKWFEQYFESAPMFTDEELDRMKSYAWILWRDSSCKETEEL